MSIDLGVWDSSKSLTNSEAGEIYAKLCKEWPHLEGNSANVAAFYNELIEKWPEIDTIPEEKIGDFDFCPWSCALNHSGMAIVMSCVWSKANEVGEFVGHLAQKHHLLLFDPQANRAVLPKHLSLKTLSLWQRLFNRT